jgi:hypothetical protein
LKRCLCIPGGDAALLTYIAENTQYPEVAKENNIQGRVIVRFCVTAKVHKSGKYFERC